MSDVPKPSPPAFAPAARPGAARAASVPAGARA